MKFRALFPSIELLENRIAPAGLIKTGPGGLVLGGGFDYTGGTFTGGSISLAGDLPPPPRYTLIGDVNGDGLGDSLAVGVWRELVVGNGQPVYYVVHSQATWVVFGGANVANPGQLNGTNGFRIEFGNADSRPVKGIGDINGDGYDDLAVAVSNDSSTSVARVIYGQGTPFATVRQMGGPTSVNVADPVFASTALPDVNGDDFEDTLLTPPEIDPQGSGGAPVSYFVYGGYDVDVTLSKNGRKATYLDPYHGQVTVTVSKGSLSREDFVFRGGVLQKLNLSDDGDEFAGANLTFASRKAGPAAEPLRVGMIDARGIDLGVVTVAGDLGQLDAGDADPTTLAVKQWRVHSLGTFGASTAVPGLQDPVTSDLVGGVGKLLVRGDLQGVVDITGGSVAKLGAVIIGGDLDGRAGGTEAGLIRAEGSIGSVKIRGSVFGGADFSGIIAGGKLGAVNIAHDLSSESAAKPVTVSAFGTYLPANQKSSVAIASVYIGGDVSHAQILAGTTIDLVASNPDASIGSLFVRGDWSHSRVAAGVVAPPAGTPPFGSVVLNNGLPTLGGGADPLSTIGRVVIKGLADPNALGLIAERIGKITVHGQNYLVPTSGDL